MSASAQTTQLHDLQTWDSVAVITPLTRPVITRQGIKLRYNRQSYSCR